MKIDMEKLIQLVMETQSFLTNEEAASQVTVKEFLITSHRWITRYRNS